MSVMGQWNVDFHYWGLYDNTKCSFLNHKEFVLEIKVLKILKSENVDNKNVVTVNM